MKNRSLLNDSGLMMLSLRLVVGWTYFSAFWRRVVLVDKLDPTIPGYIGEKFNHFLPNSIGIKPIIQYLVENPDLLHISMILFTIIECIVGLFLILGLFSRLMNIGIVGLAFSILLGSGWIGTTCLDEWQIGALGVAAGFTMFLAGSGKYSLDNYLIRKNFAFTKKKWFVWLGSGELTIKESIFGKIAFYGAILIFALTLFTNQVFHNGICGNLHNKSVKPKLELSDAKFEKASLDFDIYRVEGVDVYGAWIIGIDILDSENNKVVEYNQDDLTKIDKKDISNYYIAKIKPGKHSLIVPLGGKAKLSLNKDTIKNLPNGDYTIKITDISGASWSTKVTK